MNHQKIISAGELTDALETIHKTKNTSIAVMIVVSNKGVELPYVLTLRLHDDNQFYGTLGHMRTTNIIISNSPIGGVYQAIMAYTEFRDGLDDTIYLVDKNPIV